MLGPTFGHMATSVIGLLLIEILSMEMLLPPMAPVLEGFTATWGKPLALLIGSLANFSVAFWGIGGIMALPALLSVEKWKIQVNKSLDVVALLQSMPLVIFNAISGVVFAVVLMYLVLPERCYNWRALPSSTTLTRDVVVWILCEEVMFFYVHRWLHDNKAAYAKIHKIHHTWTAPVSLVAIYCHPVEHILSNIIPLLAGPIICSSHLASLAVFMFVAVIHTVAVHSGYWICDDNGFHDEHHRKFDVNYGVSGLLDTLYGTYQLPPGAVIATGDAALRSKLA